MSRPPRPETAAPTGQGEADGLWIATCDEVAHRVEILPLKPIADERPILVERGSALATRRRA